MSRWRWLTLFGASFATGLAAEVAERRRARLAERARRGRLASWPWEMTWLGWKDVLVRTFWEFFEDGSSRWRPACPSIFCSRWCRHLGSRHALWVRRRSTPSLGAAPAGAQRTAGGRRGHRRRAGDPACREVRERPVAYLLVSLSIAGWSANAGIKAMFDALNVIYDEQEKRSFIRLNLLSLTATVSGIFC